MPAVHFMPGGERTACGLNRREAGELRWSEHKLATTCELCQNTPQFRAAIQRIPIVPGGPYRHVR